VEVPPQVPAAAVDLAYLRKEIKSVVELLRV
jgi:hypothetical protein